MKFPIFSTNILKHCRRHRGVAAEWVDENHRQEEEYIQAFTRGICCCGIFRKHIFKMPSYYGSKLISSKYMMHEVIYIYIYIVIKSNNWGMIL